jgi:ubiquinone/menaquinone biosynthesis C-methylase UbiE
MRLRRRSARAAVQPPAAPAPETPPRSPQSQWFWDHYEWAAGQIVDFFDGTGAALDGAEIADVGCGDGILSLGFARRAQPARLVGFDVNPVDLDNLARMCVSEGVDPTLPASLEFQVSAQRGLPAADASFDVVTTWSAFEHIGDPYALLREIRRILRPGGVLFLQLWPFYYSERGSHLWEWFPDGFHHLQEHHTDTVAKLERSELKERGWTEMMSREFVHLNRVTLDELQRCILAAGLSVTKLELLSHTVTVPRDLARYPLSDLGISGVKLLAAPAD